MPFSTKDLVSNDQFFAAVLRCARELVAMYDENPRITSIFAAQQRWLLAHAGFALYFGHPDDPTPALYTARFVDFVREHNIASRNTAVAFIQEMIAYRFLRPVASNADRRTRLLEPNEMAREQFLGWLLAHFSILDGLDGGDRVAKLAADTSAFSLIQPIIATQI